jgi:hypothetical protein
MIKDKSQRLESFLIDLFLSLTRFDLFVEIQHISIGGTIMNLIRTRLTQSIRTLLVAFTCAILFFSTAFPALAGGKTAPSDLTKGEAPLTNIIDKSEDVIQNGLPTMKEVQKRSNEGINEIQGSADMNKMSRPDNSRQAVSIEERIKTGLEKAEGKD